MGRAVTSGVKGGDDIRVPRLRGGPQRSQPTEASLKRRWGQLTGHCCVSSRVTTAYHLHVFFSLATLNIQKSLKHSNKRCRKAELSTCAPCLVHTQRAASHGQKHRALLRVIWTNKYNSQFKHANRKRCERAKFSTRAPWAERRVSKRINAEFVSSCSCTNKYIQSYVKILVLESILKNTVCYVLYSFVKNWMCIIILDALSLKVTTSNLQELSMSLMLIQENERKKIAHCSWLNHL